MFGQLGRIINRMALSDPSYRFLFEAEPGNEVVSLDCETTGFDHWADEIVSIAAIRVAGRRIHASSAFRALVKPEATVPASSIKIHQLRQQDVAAARPMAEVLPDLLHFIGSRPLVGYWISFDVRMLDKYLLAMINTRLPNRQIDVSQLYYEATLTTADGQPESICAMRRSGPIWACPRAPNTMRSRTRSARLKCISCSRTCAKGTCGCRVGRPGYRAIFRSPDPRIMRACACHVCRHLISINAVRSSLVHFVGTCSQIPQSVAGQRREP